MHPVLQSIRTIRSRVGNLALASLFAAAALSLPAAQAHAETQNSSAAPGKCTYARATFGEGEQITSPDGNTYACKEGGWVVVMS